MSDIEAECIDGEQHSFIRGRERAAVELAKMPPDDGTVTVSLPDAAKIDREHFKLCRTCGWARPGRCQCPPGPPHV